MKTGILILIVGMFFQSSYSQNTWHDLLNQPGPISFKTVQQKFEEEQKQENKVASQSEYESDNTFYYRWAWYNRPRLDEHGDLTNPSWRALQAELALQNKIETREIGPAGNWQFLGPNQLNTNIPSLTLGIGRVNSISFDQSGTLYLGTASGGAWKGTGNNTWSCLTNSIPELGVSSICIDYINNNNIYLLTGDGDAADHEHNGPTIGILKSTDGGHSWFQTGFKWDASFGFYGRKLIMDPVNPLKLIVVGTFGIYQTVDGGNYWTSVQAGDFFDVEVQPGNTNVWYASTNNSFFRSMDGGNSWSQIAIPGLNTSISNRIGIAVTAANSNDVYVLAGSTQSPFYLGCWLFSNSGSTFTLQSNSPNIFGAGDGSASDNVSQADYDLSLAVNPSNANEIFFGGINIWISEDGGATWSKNSSWQGPANDNMHADQHAIEFNGSDVWVGNDGGIFKYDPGNITAKWSQQFNGLGVTQYYHLAVDPLPGTYNYAGAQDNGVQRYDGDDNNQIVSNGGDGGDAAVDYTNDGIVYYDSNGTLQCQGSNLGDPCWPTKDDHTPYSAMASCACPDIMWTSAFAVGTNAPDRPIVIDPTNNNWVWTGFNGIYKSTDQTNTWTFQAGAPFDRGLYNGMRINVNSRWAIKPSYVVRENPFGSGVWKKIPDGLPRDSITGLETNPNNPLEAWITCGGYNSTSKVYHTTLGNSWTNITHSGLPNVPVNCIVRDKTSPLNALYVGTDIGVFYTDDNLGGTWIPFRNGLPSVIVTDLEINYGQVMIYASTYGRGLWSSTLANACASNLVLSGTIPFGYYLHEASGNITSTEVINQGYNQEVDYTATTISFEPGFDAGNGSKIVANIGACDPLSPVHERDGYFAGTLSSNDSIQIQQVPPLPVNSGVIGIFPNPASSTVSIQYSLRDDAIVNMQLYDLQMHLLNVPALSAFQLRGNHIATMDLNSLSDGIYFLLINIANSRSLQKIVVQR